MPHIPWKFNFIRLIAKCKHSVTVAQVHALSVTAGISTELNVVNRLIVSYSKDNNVISAQHLFDRFPDSRVETWNSMIVAYTRLKEYGKVLGLYSTMMSVGIRPDSSTFTLSIKACSSLMDCQLGEKIWLHAVNFGYGSDLFVRSSALNLFTKCRQIEKAKAVFEGMIRKDVVSWTTMIMGLIQSGKAVAAVDCYKQMRAEGVVGDGVEMLGLIQVSADVGNLKLGTSVHGYLVRREMVMNHVVIQTSLLYMYAKNGKSEIASTLFENMPHKNAVTWGALISGFAQNGFTFKALTLFTEMNNSGYKQHTASLVSALLACSQAGYLKLGKSIHGFIVKSLCADRILGTGLVDMYAKCGALDYARRVFDMPCSRDLISWNTMLAGYGIHGQGEEALALFLQMKKTALKPDQVTFSSLLSAFSHSGLVNEGLYCFETMINDCKIQPNENHYASMVDLLSRAGRIEDAYQLIYSMRIEPNHPVWVALLSGCHIHRNITIGKIAVKKIIDSDPQDMGVYSLVSNFLSMAKKWDEVASLKKIMKNSGSRKVPGYSALEIDGKNYTFFMEDNSFSQHHQTLHILTCLFDEMKLIRQDPDVDFIA